MNRELKPLLDAAERTHIIPQQKEEQRRSFAFGNTAIENDRITRALVNSRLSNYPPKSPMSRQSRRHSKALMPI